MVDGQGATISTFYSVTSLLCVLTNDRLPIARERTGTDGGIKGIACVVCLCSGAMALALRASFCRCFRRRGRGGGLVHGSGCDPRAC